MAYPVNPTEFPTTPQGSVSAPSRLRLATFGFTAERGGGVIPPPPIVPGKYSFSGTILIGNGTITINA